MATKYVFVTGGVASALGKGITAASLGRLLKNISNYYWYILNNCIVIYLYGNNYIKRGKEWIYIEKYLVIIQIIAQFYGIDDEEICVIMKRRECKYLLLLLMRKFNCLDKGLIKDQLQLKSDKTIKNNIVKAEEKLLMNKEFRDNFFYLEEKIEKNF